MKALVLTTDGDNRNPQLQWEDVPEPEVRHHDVLIRVIACGVCGTDVHCTRPEQDGRIGYSGGIRTPVVIGHECAGIVEDVGVDVLTMRKGDLVTCEGMIGCGVCRACCGGYPNQCPELRMLGLSRDGAFAEFLSVHERFCWPLNRLMDRVGDATRTCELGALVEPISCSYTGIFLSSVRMIPGDHVVVYGAGPVGLGAIALARVAGAATVTVVEPMKERRQLAAQLGADRVHDPYDAGLSISQCVLDVTDGRGANLQIECAGALTEIVPEVEKCFAPGGRLLYLGRTGENVSVELDRYVSGANAIVGSRGHVGGSFPKIIDLLERGRLNVEGMLTSRYQMSQAVSAIAQAARREDGKVMVLRDR